MYFFQGTARPTKYRLVHDDSDFDEEELEILSYYLCHMFSRSTRAVSYPAPTYYSHLAALRFRRYLDVTPVNLNDLKAENRRTQVKEAFKDLHPMFFV